MIQFVKAEYFKLWKSRSLWPVFGLLSLPVLFSLLVFLEIDGLTIMPGGFSLFTFANNLWQFLVGTSVSVVLFASLGSSLGKELQTGTMVYQATRVGNRNRLMQAKVLTLLSLNLVYFFLFHAIGAVAYLLLIHGGPYGSESVWDVATQQELTLGLVGLGIQIGFSFLAMFLSLRLQMISVILFSFVGGMGLSYLSSLEQIALYIPGSLFYKPSLVPDDQFYATFLFQMAAIGVISLIAIFMSKKKFAAASL